MGPSIGIGINNLKPSHSGNTYPLRFLLILMLKKQLKLLAMAFDQDLTCLIFPLRWAHLPIKNSHKAQWVHLFSINFDGFRPFRLYFILKWPFPKIKSSHSGNTIYMRLLSMKDSAKIELFYFDDNFRHIAQWVLAFIRWMGFSQGGTVFLRLPHYNDMQSSRSLQCFLIMMTRQVVSYNTSPLFKWPSRRYLQCFNSSLLI